MHVQALNKEQAITTVSTATSGGHESTGVGSHAQGWVAMRVETDHIAAAAMICVAVDQLQQLTDQPTHVAICGGLDLPLWSQKEALWADVTAEHRITTTLIAMMGQMSGHRMWPTQVHCCGCMFCMPTGQLQCMTY
jgi:hypothetical protein